MSSKSYYDTLIKFVEANGEVIINSWLDIPDIRGDIKKNGEYVHTEIFTAHISDEMYPNNNLLHVLKYYLKAKGLSLMSVPKDYCGNLLSVRNQCIKKVSSEKRGVQLKDYRLGLCDLKYLDEFFVFGYDLVVVDFKEGKIFNLDAVYPLEIYNEYEFLGIILYYLNSNHDVQVSRKTYANSGYGGLVDIVIKFNTKNFRYIHYAGENKIVRDLDWSGVYPTTLGLHGKYHKADVIKYKTKTDRHGKKFVVKYNPISEFLIENWVIIVIVFLVLLLLGFVLL